MLQYQVDAVPEGMEQFYQAHEGKFVLKVEGLPQVEDKSKELADAKAKLDEFRTNNRELFSQLEKLKGVDTSAQVEELVKQAVAANTQKLQSIEQEKAQLAAQLEEVIISDKLKEAAIKYGVAETAVQDILNRGKAAFTVKDGKPLPRNGAVDGDGNVLSPEAWVKALQTEAPHLFKQSTGTGAKRPVGNGFTQTPERTANQKLAAGLDSLRRK